MHQLLFVSIAFLILPGYSESRNHRALRSTSGIGMRSVSVRGSLKCGATPLENAVVRLYRVPSQEEGQVLDERTTGPSGMFQLNANTNGRQLNETDLRPVVKVYHRCGDDAGSEKNGFRRFQLSVPEDYVTLGRIAKRTFDVGELNTELKYPNEKRDKNFKPT